MDQRYYEYLRSEAWQKKRLAALKAARYRCQKCGSRVPLHIHHITYERFGNEDPDDLVALCATCHRAADANRKLAVFIRGLNTWATKCYGQDWESTIGWQEAVDGFEEWLARKAIRD